jgi:hypothetical protein
MNDFLQTLSILILFLSSIVFITGLIFTVLNNKKRKLGLYLIFGSIISFIIGFCICLNSFVSGIC